MRVTSFLILVLFGSLLASCEANTERIRIVKNASLSDITVHTMGYDSVWNSTHIPSGRRETVLTASEFGGSDVPSLPLYDVYGFFIVNANGDTLLKNTEEIDSWVVYIRQVSKVPDYWEHEYVLNVLDDDFN